ncbi:uncharacterized protein MYCGRDRAFT_87598 [Zymoseptoria tritici IPO323]|uniref:non-specific serine/threonine protein kinase n=1 Tax=Zymoseptoria tritici (strain CBS 115943 / IPO323) TaxID=336722 RepID=F9XK15_ZYMTI|nr:uncharacterized protein MYCGRDRAFT_87598 [Zymoseptoria tritici IPO323]EGP84476.1 hypothetical protein MYCGRDRAFT_87598 [Zymoseptoria tritici IPO323]
MKLDTAALRYLNDDDWRVLAAVEQGSKNHEVVPTPLIASIAHLRGGNDGYRLTYGGFDYLSLNNHRRSNTIFSVGNQIGVGKEADVYITASPDGEQMALKLHRLGRISFRTVKANRDYLRNRHAGSWMYLSQLAAQKEYSFMVVLHREGFPVPRPIAWSRHTVVMEFIDSFPLRGIESIPDPGKLYAELMDMIVQLAKRGLIHGDFNEFNILIKEKTIGEKIELQPVLIDFPQTVSTNHANAQWYFDRDVECIRRYFERKFKYTSDARGPSFKDAVKGADPAKRLDVESTGGIKSEADADVDDDEDDDDEEEEEDDDDEDDEFEEVAENNADAPDGEDGKVQPGLEQKEAASVDDADLVKDVEVLTVEDDTEGKQLMPEKFGFQPMDLPREADVAAEKVRSKKKASGWAI